MGHTPTDEEGFLKLSPFKRLFFIDVDPLIYTGYKKRLEESDLYRLKNLRTEVVHDNFSKAWEEQKKLPTPNIKKAILAGNVALFIWTGILYGIAQATTLAGPLLLQRIVSGLQCIASGRPGCEPRSELYYYCIGLFLAPAVQSICENHQMYQLNILGTRIRNSLMAAIYHKCLKLSNAALQTEDVGKVQTLMSNDAQKLQDAMMAIHAMWGSPLYIGAVLGLLYQQVGWATFVGLGIMLVLVPITGKVAMKLGSFRRDILKWTQKRVGLMNELINGIQMIKFYAWESCFKAEVMKCRNEEAKILKSVATWTGMFGMVLFSGPVLVAIFCFGSWSLAGNVLTTANAYAALALFSLLRFPMSFLPMLITMLINANIALKRIQGFLMSEEAPPTEDLRGGVTPGHIHMKDAVVKWSVPEKPPKEDPAGKGKGKGKADKKIPAKGKVDDADKGVKAGENEGEKKVEEKKDTGPTLHGLTFEANPGSLTMVVGSVGSGKSSLASALIGYINKVSGDIKVGGSIAYVAQTAWIINDTLQENVLLGNPLDPERYKMAVEAAQLMPDIEMLPNGDMTEIGDRGVTLSGGQKQRVSIARAVYANADVYVMDDPLSAVDSHVGRALFEECIRTVLRSKTVILVTNALQYLPSADNILWLMDSTIKAQGTLSQLNENGLNIAELVHVQDDHKEAEEKEAEMIGNAEKKPIVKKSTAQLTLTKQENNRNLTGIEERESGSIGTGVLKIYLIAGGGIIAASILFALFCMEQGARVYTDMWVGIWFSNEYGVGNVWFYLGLYAALGIFYGLCTFGRALNFMYLCVNAAVNLHNSLLDHILRLPKSFFDTNPAGRVLNRFSRDVEIMDATLSQSLIQFLGCVATFLSILVVISFTTVWFAIAIVPLTIVYFFLQRYYIPSGRELQRIESVSRSPIYSRFSEALQGLPTIRAYGREQHFTAISNGLMETNAWAFATQRLAASWLATRLDVFGLAVLTGTGALCISGSISPGFAGLALVYALDLTRFLKFGTAMASKSEADFNSVERVVQYMKPATEAAAETTPEMLATMPKDWPTAGAITVTKLHMRYRPEMPLVLKGVSFHVNAGEKVGLVGRTGSGKSSLLLALFRMVEAESGSIVIDGVDISKLGVWHLRSRMSIIPQDPFMFSGSVRHNLDPFSQSQESELWEVLERVGLKPVITELPEKLDAAVTNNGGNFSLGQRQLFCLARAMLRKSRILMLDEATASIDHETDSLIQTAVREVFGACTQLTIAHRLNTIMDNDRVIVMDAGCVVENGEPQELLKNDEGVFTSMVDMTGRSSSKYLKSLANNASDLRRQQTGLSVVAEESGASVTGKALVPTVVVPDAASSDSSLIGTAHSASDDVPLPGAVPVPQPASDGSSTSSAPEISAPETTETTAPVLTKQNDSSAQ